ncbi:hypothetical protein [Halpernia frigidisoli]|uniref:Lipoprotein n=1 Tax=Halpernia frigidisoli TaxID=1125876 RepID=A0A1I3IPY9_9FLAO|nr:hypothetical protein [Halpernia frigidisoli]SFI50031.1 hypothetical protein SAMN05443292_2730 [Halpernia frigidisoli]
MKNLIIISTYFFFLSGCKKEQIVSAQNTISTKKKPDTVKIEDKNIVIFINPTLPYIDSLKNSYKNKDDFYTVADDANFYTAEAGDYIIKKGVDTININNRKILKIGTKVINISKYKPWTLLLYKKGESQVKNIFSLDIENEFSNYYVKNKENSDGDLESVLINNKFNPSNILFKNEFDFNTDGLKDYILILNKEDNLKTIILIERTKNNYSLSFANDNAIPCEECGNGAESFYDYKVEKDNIFFSSSYKSNENIYKIDFKFKNNKDNAFILDKVIIYKSEIGESSENKIVLDKSTFGLKTLKDFNYSNFISKYILK